MIAKLADPPVIEPVSLVEAKTFLRIDTGDEDSLIDYLITAARHAAEKYTSRSFITQTWKLYVERVVGTIYLPYSPVQEIESVTVGGVEIPPSKYSLVGDDAFSVIQPLIAVTPESVLIRYITGYGSDPEDVPADIRQAILITVAHLYENREIGGIPPGAIELLRPYRVLQV